MANWVGLVGLCAGAGGCTGMNAPNLDVTWDTAKAQSNIVNHGVTFAQAATMLLDPLALTVFDAADSDVEERWFTLGKSIEGKLLGAPYLPSRQGQPAPRCASFRRERPRAASVSSTRTNPDR